MNLVGLLWVFTSMGNLLTLQSAIRMSDSLLRTIPTLMGNVTETAIRKPRYSRTIPTWTISLHRSPKTTATSAQISTEGIHQYLALQLTRSALLPQEGWSLVKGALLNPEPLHQSIFLPPEGWRSSVSVPTPPARVAPPSVLPVANIRPALEKPQNPILRLIHEVFQWSKGVGTPLHIAPPLVTIAPVTQSQLELESPHLFSLSLQPDENAQAPCLSQANLSLQQTSNTVFQVRVKGHKVADLPTKAQADSLAQQFQQVLHSPAFDPHALQIEMVQDQPTGKAGNATLFQIDAELATQYRRSPEVIAIAWVNNLRSAFNLPPLSLAEAQSQMHGLLPTQRQLKGTASWYGPFFHGRLTATGETFDQTQLTAAHPSLPFDTFLQVKNLQTGNTVIVRINDRGPYFENRSLDLSREAARCLNSEKSGVVPYEAIVMQPASSHPPSR